MILSPEYLSIRNSQKNLQKTLFSQLPLTSKKILDIGCGNMPNKGFFDQHKSNYIGIDINKDCKPHAIMTAEYLAIASSTIDLVIYTAVLEHVSKPLQSLKEIHRVLKPGGKIILQTHGIYCYHPSPSDHWRWTHTGLEIILKKAGLIPIAIYPSGSTLVTYITFFAQAINHFLYKSIIFSWLRFPSITLINLCGLLLDKSIKTTPFDQPGSLIISYTILARKSRKKKSYNKSLHKNEKK
jgi:ubiquinone/menaquinone biosynthesis C-methylase UbiE